MALRAPTGSLGVAAMVLGCCLPPPAAAPALVLPHSCPLPLVLAQGLLLSTSLRVLPVVLPYGRLRHAVLPQGRTTDGMPGLPPRLRTPVSLRSRGSRARMGPIPRCSGLEAGLPRGSGGVCVCAHNSLWCVSTCTAAWVGRSRVVPAGIPGAPSGASGKLGCFLLVHPEAKPRTAPPGRRVPSPRHTRAQHRHPEETGTRFVRGVLHWRQAVPSPRSPLGSLAP